MWAMPLIADLRGVDVYHGPFNIHPAGLKVRRVVTTVHDLMWVSWPEICRQPGAWGYVETFYWGQGLRRALRKSDRLLTVSEASRRAIAELDPAAGERTRVTRNGIEANLRPALSSDDDRAIAAMRAKFLPGVPQYVLSVGQFSGYKNHEGVVRAFARAFRDRPEVHLVFVHRLGKSSRLLPLAKSLGIQSRLHFLHGLSDDELRALFWAALCLCHPSFIEGFGLPIAEAMACGCPVVTSDVSAPAEVAGDGALLVDPLDDGAIAHALRRMADEPDTRRDLRARALERVKSFVWRDCAEKTLAAYREIL
jgi:glycosyltransferase involved in cell wall biosynthesis